MDDSIFYWFYEKGQKNKNLYRLCHRITSLSHWVFISVYAISITGLILMGNPLLFKYIVIPFGALIVNLLLREVLKKQRPYEKFHLEVPVKKRSFSFPSNHSLSSAVIAVSTIFIFPAGGSLLLFCTVLTGISRIVLGYHFPSDVLMGWFLGVLIGGAGFILF